VGGRVQRRVRDAKEYGAEPASEAELDTLCKEARRLISKPIPSRTTFTPQSDVTVPKLEESTGYGTTTQRHIQGNSLCKSGMEGLYKQMGASSAPAQTLGQDALPAFKDYYQQHFQSNSLSAGVMQTLYKQMIPSASAAQQPEATQVGPVTAILVPSQSKHEGAMSIISKEKTFSAYYQQHFKSNALCQGTMEALYKQMAPTTPSAPQVCQPPFKHLASVGTWMMPRIKAQPIAFEVQEEIKAQLVEEAAPEKAPTPFRFLASVGTWMAPSFKAQPIAIEVQEEIKAQPMEEAVPEKAPTPFRLLASVGTWMAPSFKAPEQAPAEVVEPPFRFKPSCATWCMPRLKVQEQLPEVQETVEAHVKMPETANVQTRFSWRPSVGTWMLPPVVKIQA